MTDPLNKETQLTGVLNLPLGDQAGMRLVGYYRNMDGYMFNTTLGHDDKAWKSEAFQNIVRRGIYWAAGRKPK